MQEEDQDIKRYIPYIIFLLVNLFVFFGLIIIVIKKIISVTAFIIIIAVVALVYTLGIVIWYIKTKYFPYREERKILESDIIDKDQAREFTLKMMKRQFSILIDLGTGDFKETVVHMGAEGKPKTPIYLLKARHMYSKNIYWMAMRLDNPTKTVVQKKQY